MAEITQTEIKNKTTTTTRDVPVESDTGLLSNILLIIGAIIVIVIVLWGLFHFISLARPWLSSLFPQSAPSITLSAPAQTTSGQPFTLSWKNSDTASGTYSLLYQCKTGVELATPGQNNLFVAVPCGESYTLTGATSSAVILPLLSGTSSASIPVSIVFAPQGGSPIQGSATIAIAAGSAQQPTQTTPTTPSKPSTPAPAAPVYSGPADLSVRIISATMNSAGQGSVSFDIANTGGSPTGTYYFSAQLPMAQPYNYQSTAQASLAPGAHIVNTLNFSDGAYGGTFSVLVTSSSAEASKANNSASQLVY